MLDKPEIEFPDFPAPADLVIEDLVVGEGDEALPGGRVRVHYMGVAASSSSRHTLVTAIAEPVPLSNPEKLGVS